MDLNFFLWAADSTCQTCNPNPLSYCVFCLYCSVPTVQLSVFNTACTPEGGGGGCPTLYVWDGNKFVPENNILAISQSTNLAVEDFIEPHRIKLPLIEENGVYRLQIIENDDDVSTFDKIDLVALDRDNNIETLMDKAGSFFRKKQTIMPTRVMDHNGFNVTKLLQEKDDNSYYCSGPGYLDAEYKNLPTVGANKTNKTNAGGDEVPDDGTFPPPKEWPADSTINKISPNFDRTGTANHLDVLLKRDTTWELVETIYGSIYNRDQLLIHYPKDAISDGSMTIRYRWNHSYLTDQIALVTTEKLSNPIQHLNMIKATHSRLGDIKSKLAMADNTSAELLPNDTISLVFEALPKDLAKEREFALITKGRYTTYAASTFFTELSDTTDNVNSFKMNQNYPNPSNPSTTFEFALPQAEHVNLVIYNVLGQKVKTLTDKFYEAGKHKIHWDGNNSSGSELVSGIYFAKLIAGNNVSTKKVMLLK